MATRRNKTRKGGAFVRKGSYGCAFKNPPLKCKSETRRRSDKQLSKLLDYDKAYEEYQQSVPFKRIDPTGFYFLSATDMCELDVANVKPENNMKECIRPVINATGAQHQVVHLNAKHRPTLLFYELGGQDISDIPLKSGQYAPFFSSFNTLLEGLALLHKNHMVHLDIKSLNIVSKEESNGLFSTRFIDFGLSMNTTRVDTHSNSFRNISQFFYPYYPFDFRHAYPYKSKTVQLNEVNKWYKMMEEYIDYLPQPSFWTPDDKQKYGVGQMQLIVNNTNYNAIEQYLQKVDVYSLGITMSEVYTTLTNHVIVGDKFETHIRINNKHIPISRITKYDLGGDSANIAWHENLAKIVTVPLTRLILKMIQPDSNKRATAKEALIDFNTYVLPGIAKAFNSIFTGRALRATGLNVPESPIAKPFQQPQPQLQLQVQQVPKAVPIPQQQPQQRQPIRFANLRQQQQLPQKQSGIETVMREAQAILAKPLSEVKPYSDPKAAYVGISDASKTSEPKGPTPEYLSDVWYSGKPPLNAYTVKRGHTKIGNVLGLGAPRKPTQPQVAQPPMKEKKGLLGVFGL